VCRYEEEVVSDMLTRQFMSVMGLVKSGRALSPLSEVLPAPPAPPKN